MKTATLPTVDWCKMYGQLAEAVDFQGLTIVNRDSYISLVQKDDVVVNNGHPMNAVEQMEAAVDWLNYADGELAYQLRSAEDALKLWRYFRQNRELPEFPDEVIYDENDAAIDLRPHFRKAIGYVPALIEDTFSVYCEL